MNELKESIKRIRSLISSSPNSPYYLISDREKFDKDIKILVDFASLAIKAEGFPEELSWDEAKDSEEAAGVEEANKMHQLCLAWHTAWVEKKLGVDAIYKEIREARKNNPTYGDLKTPLKEKDMDFYISQAIQDYFRKDNQND